MQFYNFKNMLNYILIYLQMAYNCYTIESGSVFTVEIIIISQDVIKFYCSLYLVYNPAARQFQKSIFLSFFCNPLKPH